MKNLIDKLEEDHILTKEEFIRLIDGRTPELAEYLFGKSACDPKTILRQRCIYARADRIYKLLQK